MKASVAIVGGGLHGLSLAFNLARRGLKEIVVLDANYWQGGASGRNGTLVRGGFSSPEWSRFFGYSLELWLDLSRTLGHNVMFTRRGYVILAESERTAAVCDSARAIHRQVGVQSSAIEGEDVRRLLPLVDHRRVKGGIHFDAGGTAPHHAAMKGYLAACRERGVTVRYGSEVTGIECGNGRVSAVVVGDERIDAEAVVIAAGSLSPKVAELAGVVLEGKPFRLEACALEPLRPVIGPALAMLDRTVYLHQTGRGEIVGGCEVPGEHVGLSLASDLPVMAAYARHLVEMMPALGSLRILRQWAGHVHATADWGPLLGRHPDLRDLWISAGWLYGVAGAPASGDLLAKAIVTGEVDARMAPFAVDRQRQGRSVKEQAIGAFTIRPESLSGGCHS